ncbi:MAG: iron-containing alcohol dehydrogenase [Desulfohalobiaceae bacterium]|nr:iron-containing alcohol dehydrogenase [Desulfohalobiaceae bacterium]
MIFHQPVKLFFGPGEIKGIQGIVHNELQSGQPLLITDKGLTQTGLAESIRQSVKIIEIFDSIEQNPTSLTVNRIGALARRLKPDLIIGLGGGSVLDAAKAASVLAANPGLIEDYEGAVQLASAPLPVLAVPTTCGTGSEVTRGAVITDTKRRFKMSVKSPQMYPRAAIVDPDLLATLPQPVVAATGLDALTHAIEAYTSRPANLITDHFALQATKLILGSIEAAHQNIARNKEAREDLMYGSTLAGFAFGNSDVGAVHCLAESLGGLFDTPHGVANAIFLPFVMKFNLRVCAERYKDLAVAAGIREENSLKAASELIERIVSISRNLNLPGFSDLGIDRSQFNRIAESSVQNGSNPSNPRQAGIQDYLDILEDALAG